jgi:hypothetical protein
MSYLSRFSRSVYVLGDGLLFDEVITHMLVSDARLRVIRSRYAGDAAFLTDVSLSQPDVVLMTETQLFSCDRILALLSQISREADLKVIFVKHDNNFIQIFDLPAGRTHPRTGVTPTLKRITSWNELLDLIEGKPLAV